MKFAFIIMGQFDSEKDVAAFETDKAKMIGVSSLEEACMVAKQLYHGGIDCIELCGAFGDEGTRKIIDATDGKVAVGYVVHLPEQDALFNRLFANS